MMLGRGQGPRGFSLRDQRVICANMAKENTGIRGPKIEKNSATLILKSPPNFELLFCSIKTEHYARGFEIKVVLFLTVTPSDH